VLPTPLLLLSKKRNKTGKKKIQAFCLFYSSTREGLALTPRLALNSEPSKSALAWITDVYQHTRQDHAWPGIFSTLFLTEFLLLPLFTLATFHFRVQTFLIASTTHSSLAPSLSTLTNLNSSRQPLSMFSLSTSKWLPGCLPLLLFLFFFFLRYWGLKEGPTRWATPPLHFVIFFFFQDRVSPTSCPVWLQTSSLLISVSWEARIAGTSHHAQLQSWKCKKMQQVSHSWAAFQRQHWTSSKTISPSAAARQISWKY
jgi:hypothetical protein